MRGMKSEIVGINRGHEVVTYDVLLFGKFRIAKIINPEKMSYGLQNSIHWFVVEKCEQDTLHGDRWSIITEPEDFRSMARCLLDCLTANGEPCEE